MKRVFIILMAIFFALATAMAQNVYSVYDSPSNTRVYRTSSRSWDTLTKGEILDGTTIINARKKGAVKILDKSTRRIYSNVKLGRQTVNEIISSAAKSANSTFGNLNRQLAENVRNSEHRSRYYTTYGATTRGDDELSFTDSLYYAIFAGVQETTSLVPIYLIETTPVGGVVSFSVVNNSETGYYISIAYGNERQLEFCFNEDILGIDVILLPAHSNADLTGFTFAAPDEGMQYYLIASKREFWTAPLRNALKYMTPPEYSCEVEFITVVPAK